MITIDFIGEQSETSLYSFSVAGLFKIRMKSLLIRFRSSFSSEANLVIALLGSEMALLTVGALTRAMIR